MWVADEIFKFTKSFLSINQLYWRMFLTYMEDIFFLYRNGNSKVLWNKLRMSHDFFSCLYMIEITCLVKDKALHSLLAEKWVADADDYVLPEMFSVGAACRPGAPPPAARSLPSPSNSVQQQSLLLNPLRDLDTFQQVRSTLLLPTWPFLHCFVAAGCQLP